MTDYEIQELMRATGLSRAEVETVLPIARLMEGLSPEQIQQAVDAATRKGRD